MENEVTFPSGKRIWPKGCIFVKGKSHVSAQLWKATHAAPAAQEGGQQRGPSPGPLWPLQAEASASSIWTSFGKLLEHPGFFQFQAEKQPASTSKMVFVKVTHRERRGKRNNSEQPCTLLLGGGEVGSPSSPESRCHGDRAATGRPVTRAGGTAGGGQLARPPGARSLAGRHMGLACVRAAFSLGRGMPGCLQTPQTVGLALNLFHEAAAAWKRTQRCAVAASPGRCGHGQLLSWLAGPDGSPASVSFPGEQLAAAWTLGVRGAGHGQRCRLH